MSDARRYQDGRGNMVIVIPFEQFAEKVNTELVWTCAKCGKRGDCYLSSYVAHAGTTYCGLACARFASGVPYVQVRTRRNGDREYTMVN